MNKPELQSYLKGMEWTHLEFKEASFAVPKSAYETVSAFANTAGGWLVFGVRETRDGFEPVGVADPAKMSSDFICSLRAETKVNHDVLATEKLLKIGGYAVLAFHQDIASFVKQPSICSSTRIMPIIPARQSSNSTRMQSSSGIQAMFSAAKKTFCSRVRRMFATPALSRQSDA